MKITSAIRRAVRAGHVRQMTLTHKIVLAVQRWAANERDAFNNWIRGELKDRGMEQYVGDPSFDYYGYVKNMFAKMGMKGDDLEDAVQAAFVKMFVRSDPNRSLFKLYHGPEQGNFETFFRTLMKRRGLSLLRDKITDKKIKNPAKSLDRPVGEEGEGSLHEMVPGKDVQETTNKEYTEMMGDLREYVDFGDPYEGDATKVMDGLLAGQSVRQIQKTLSHPSGTWYNRVVNHLRGEVQNYFQDKGLEDIGDSIARMMEKAQSPVRTKPSSPPTAPAEQEEPTPKPEAAPGSASETAPTDEGDKEVPGHWPDWLKRMKPDARGKYFEKYPMSKWKKKSSNEAAEAGARKPNQEKKMGTKRDSVVAKLMKAGEEEELGPGREKGWKTVRTGDEHGEGRWMRKTDPDGSTHLFGFGVENGGGDARVILRKHGGGYKIDPKSYGERTLMGRTPDEVVVDPEEFLPGDE